MDVLDNLPQRIATGIRGLFNDPHSLWADFTMNIIAFLLVTILIILFALFIVQFERKMAGRIQHRVGPIRLGPHGWFQTVADALKLLGKEIFMPAEVDKVIYTVAPLVFFALTFLTFGIIPFAKGMVPIDLDLGIVYYLAISSVSTLALVMAGWSSNNKYSLLGGMRAVAQMISYEIPLAFSLLGVVMITHTFNLTRIVEAQAEIPFIVLQPLGFVVYIIAGLAEINRAPFDLIEGEQEIVAGPYTEYTGLRWGLFYLAEYVNIFTYSAFATTIFLGGWQGPSFLPGLIWFFLKTGIFTFFVVWVRWTLPRMRIDHLMNFAWKVLLPLSLANIFLTGLGIYVYRLFIPQIGG